LSRVRNPFLIGQVRSGSRVRRGCGCREAEDDTVVGYEANTGHEVGITVGETLIIFRRMKFADNCL
jgi:hypothetical protein